MHKAKDPTASPAGSFVDSYWHHADYSMSTSEAALLATIASSICAITRSSIASSSWASLLNASGRSKTRSRIVGGTFLARTSNSPSSAASRRIKSSDGYWAKSSVPVSQRDK